MQTRPYTPADREAVRRICCETGFSGDPVDRLFADRDVFADFFTRYYTDWEPESALVVEDEDGRVGGYLLGCRRYRYHAWVQPWLLATRIAPKVIWRLLRGRYDADSRAFLWWCCLHASRETPAAPKGAAHFHFNLLPEFRARRGGRLLFDRFYAMIRDSGLAGMYGQIQTSDERRSDKLFERLGFRAYDRREVSKFRPHHDRRVYVTTFYREF